MRKSTLYLASVEEETIAIDVWNIPETGGVHEDAHLWLERRRQLLEQSKYHRVYTLVITSNTLEESTVKGLLRADPSVFIADGKTLRRWTDHPVELDRTQASSTEYLIGKALKSQGLNVGAIQIADDASGQS